MATDSSVLIVGAGIAGLTCAVYLKQAGINALVLEAADGVGGRVRTDAVDGFRLDRGFQILLTAYPEAKRLLNYTALDLRSFRSGALIRQADQTWMKLLNPFQEPLSVFQTLVSPVGTFGDKLRIVELMRRTHELSIGDLFRQTPTTTLAFLRDFGFSDQIIERFFRPFFGGVFLEDQLTTSSNFFEFCFRMFFDGSAAVPAQGIGAIPAQLASRLAPGQIRLNTLVNGIDGTSVRLDTGETIEARAIVMAVDAAQAAKLTNSETATDLPESRFNHTTCTYFASPVPVEVPQQKLLMLNPQRSSAVHNLAVLTDVAPGYARPSRSDGPRSDGPRNDGSQTLISVSTQGLELVNEPALTERIRQELTSWFGDSVRQWRHLRTYHIPQALPAYGPLATHQPLRLTDSLYQCGDQTAYPSLNAAMQTGREVAELLIRQ